MPVRHGPDRRVFVVGPFIANGGTYMAYHVARIIQQEFGYTAVAVTVGDESPSYGRFSYDTIFDQVSIGEMERTISSDDLLFANAGHSRFLFGPRLPGRKIMYVQGFTTARPLDCNFDAYVSVSTFVSRFLEHVYDIAAPIIPPFVDTTVFAQGTPWEDRPAGSVIVHVKGHALELDALRSAVRARSTSIDLDRCLPESVPQLELVKLIGAARYLVTVSTAEGFGLVPLEAMAVGTVVVGFDAYGGREYMHDAVNCACASSQDYGGLADRIVANIENPERAQPLLGPAYRTAAAYDYARFRAAWSEYVERFLGIDSGATPDQVTAAIRGSSP